MLILLYSPAMLLRFTVSTNFVVKTDEVYFSTNTRISSFKLKSDLRCMLEFILI